MKKIMLTLTLATMLMGNTEISQAASNDKIVPDTSAITAKMYLDVPAGGEEGPQWNSDNPEIKTKQETAFGIYETYIDKRAGALVVKRNNEIVSSYHPYDASNDFDYGNN